MKRAGHERGEGGQVPQDVPKLVVISREYCHLCHDMAAGLKELQATRTFVFDVVDVDQDPALESRYGILVPVLLAGGEEICHYFLDVPALDAYLAKIR
ncbi:MAG: glutaredoxin family protein [Betaproteobacteria bacterium]|nr:glutaredoxin family protein [Betaproteobacteria bacterium]